MDQPIKPPVDEKVFLDGVLYYTISDWWWVPEGHALFKPGWMPLRKYNHEHPEMKRFVSQTHREQELCTQRTSTNGYMTEKCIRT